MLLRQVRPVGNGNINRTRLDPVERRAKQRHEPLPIETGMHAGYEGGIHGLNAVVAFTPISNYLTTCRKVCSIRDFGST